MNGPDRRQIEAHLDAACRTLALVAGAEQHIAPIVKMLADIAILSWGKRGTHPPAFQRRSGQATSKEIDRLLVTARRLHQAIARVPEQGLRDLLDVEPIVHFRVDLPAALDVLAQRADVAALAGISRLSRQLAKAVRGLHQPAIVALAGHGFSSPMRFSVFQVVARLANMSMVGTCPLVRGDAGEMRIGRGRKPDIRARALGGIIGNAYFKLTGMSPTIATSYNVRTAQHARSGAWFSFLNACFVAMRLGDAGDQLYRSVARQMHRNSAPA